MSELAPLARPDIGPVPHSLQDKLVWLTNFGRPSLNRMRQGWYAWVEMHVASKGTTFKIDSEIHHQTPTEAVDELIARMVATLKDLESMRG